jgi:hypothetical protein
LSVLPTLTHYTILASPVMKVVPLLVVLSFVC